MFRIQFCLVYDYLLIENGNIKVSSKCFIVFLLLILKINKTDKTWELVWYYAASVVEALQVNTISFSSLKSSRVIGSL